VESISVADGQNQLVISKQYLPVAGRTNPRVSIQLLSPTPRTAYTYPELGCR
jgi:hypothetical protein